MNLRSRVQQAGWLLATLTVAVGASQMLCRAGHAQASTFNGSQYAGVPIEVSADKLPEFEVADIQPSKGARDANARFLRGGRVEFVGVSLKLIILAAWGYENDENRIISPSWLNTEAFDIVAKAPPTAVLRDVRLMLRSLLIKRFGLVWRLGEESHSVYALEKGKGNPKITPSANEVEADCNRSQNKGVVIYKCYNMTLDELANGLSGMAQDYLDKPVVNLTGLSGRFDFAVTWTRRNQLMRTEDAAKRDAGLPLTADAREDLTVFEAVDKQLGLKLNSTKHPIPMIVVDKVNPALRRNW